MIDRLKNDNNNVLLVQQPINQPTNRSWFNPISLVCNRDARLKRTNRSVQGLVSIDRSKVAALVSTTPRPRTKSSTNDLVLNLDTVDSRFTTMLDQRYIRLNERIVILAVAPRPHRVPNDGRLGYIYASRWSEDANISLRVWAGF